MCHSVHGEVMTREPPTDQLWALFQSGASFGQFGVDNYLYTFVLMHSINLFKIKEVSLFCPNSLGSGGFFVFVSQVARPLPLHPVVPMHSP